MKQPIRLVVVDDHTLFRRGLIALLSQDTRFVVVSEAADAGEALRCAHRDAPDVILLDNHLPGVRGVDTIAALKEAAPEARVMMVTVSEDEADLAAALRAGADGYLLKTIESEDLGDSIVRLVAGHSVVSPQMTNKLVAAFRSQPGGVSAGAVAVATGPDEADALASLSPREREILALIARGDSNKAIARELGIAETTVKIHVQHILRKLQLSSRVQAAVYATERGVA